MLILKEYNLALTSSRLAISTHPGIGFVKTLCLCTMLAYHRQSRNHRALHCWNNPDSSSRPTPRSRSSSSQFLRPQVTGVTLVTSLSLDKIILLHLKRKVGSTWNKITTSGTIFNDKNTLLTGVGKGSIGVEVVKGFLSGGAHVVITTSSYSRNNDNGYPAQ